MAKLFEHVDKNEKAFTDGDDILYLVLMELCPTSGEAENYRDWKFIKGRQAVYDYIRDILLRERDDFDTDLLDVDESLIYADNPHVPAEANNLKLSNGINLYKFMKDCYALQKVKDDGGFDIEDFHIEDSDSEENE